MHRRQLPIASPCQSFVGVPASATTPAFCTRCEKHVHDLSRLSEREVVELLARHRDAPICISYRARRDGTVALRRPASRLAPATLALSLTGCAGHLADGDAGTECIDAAGYRVDCPTPGIGHAVVPDAIDPVALDVPETSLVQGGLVDGTTIEPSSGDAGLIEPPPPEPEPPALEHGTAVAQDEFRMMGAMVDIEPGSPLSRKVEREAKRLARRERRKARRDP